MAGLLCTAVGHSRSKRYRTHVTPGSRPAQAGRGGRGVSAGRAFPDVAVGGLVVLFEVGAGGFDGVCRLAADARAERRYGNECWLEAPELGESLRSVHARASESSATVGRWSSSVGDLLGAADDGDVARAVRHLLRSGPAGEEEHGLAVGGGGFGLAASAGGRRCLHDEGGHRQPGFMSFHAGNDQRVPPVPGRNCDTHAPLRRIAATSPANTV